METLGTLLHKGNQLIETALGIAVALVLMAGSIFLIAQKLTALRDGLRGHSAKRQAGGQRASMWWTILPALVAALAVPALAAAEGWWWGSPINPGFDRSTVIQVSGTARHINLAGEWGPGTLTLECDHDSYTVMLAPTWYLAQSRADIREGDTLTVEGSKMMDRKGKLYLVAARVTNERTGTVVELRDEMGRPRWMGGPRPGRMMH